MTDPGPQTDGGNYVYSRELALKVRVLTLDPATPDRSQRLFRMIKLPNTVSEQLCAPGLGSGCEGNVLTTQPVAPGLSSGSEGSVLTTQPVALGLKMPMAPPTLPWPSMSRVVPAGCALDLVHKDPAIAGVMLAARPEAHVEAVKAAQRAALALWGGSTEAVALEVKNQIEYYFSVKNVCQDSYLRSRMDDDGWVSLKEITGFPKLRALSVNVTAAAKVLQNSTTVEISEDGKRARVMNGMILQLFPRITGIAQPAPAQGQHGTQRRKGAGAP